jgi:hypothetical protein
MLADITEAYRYLDNAKEILRDKARKEEGHYQDPKYVKMAGHTAYTGLLLALDAYLDPTNIKRKKKERRDVSWYKQKLSELDKKILTIFNSAYFTLHLAMGYDGNPNAAVVKGGLDDAELLLEWLKTRTEATATA